jgi:hypothetical protein
MKTIYLILASFFLSFSVLAEIDPDFTTITIKRDLRVYADSCSEANEKLAKKINEIKGDIISISLFECIDDLDEFYQSAKVIIRLDKIEGNF